MVIQVVCKFGSNRIKNESEEETKKLTHDAHRRTDIDGSQKLTMSLRDWWANKKVGH